ncbi:UDP-Glycosyltransferase superfamily protein [Artemisia annua]|uniref:UDP-Glycosyltransferase superfamily protein n=1 Tax=Artemisia annua TaxID=35608 RepID=A0A2U1KGL4_ARTAN|nr:UDP-Glycosyltransferase superfamily protein [Artemisia annua]
MTTNQVVVVPYPGRGHINPMLNLCNLLSSGINHKHNHTFFTIVITKEWLGLINPEPDQINIWFVTIPNVLPCERNRGSDMLAFLTTVNTKMGDPFEEMLDKMEVPVKLIIADATMNWP